MQVVDWQALAAGLLAELAPQTRREMVNLRSAPGRVLAEDIPALTAIPSFDHAVMDGYAVGSPAPGCYRLQPAGTASLLPDEAMPIAAGRPVARNATAVILAHNGTVSDGHLHVEQRPRRDNIRRAGEEAQAGECLLAAGTLVDARHYVLAAAAGLQTLPVHARPRVALVGVQDDLTRLPHATMLEALLSSPSLILTAAGVVRQIDLQRQLSMLAPNHDLIVVVAESLDSEDGALVQALTTAQGTPKVWRAALKPAKPIIAGQIGQTAVLGLAGTCYATVAAAHLFLRPMLQCLCGMEQKTLAQPAFAGFSRSREAGRAEALPVLIRRTGSGLTLTPAGRFGQLRALADMDGMALVEAGQGDIAPGTALTFLPMKIPLV